LLGDGLSTQQIAERLHLSMKTMDAHRAKIKEKLKLKTTNEVISYAARWTISPTGRRAPFGE
jgi:DNA-binding CsgD family transcriptional regulator